MKPEDIRQRDLLIALGIFTERAIILKKDRNWYLENVILSEDTVKTTFTIDKREKLTDEEIEKGYLFWKEHFEGCVTIDGLMEKLQSILSNEEYLIHWEANLEEIKKELGENFVLDDECFIRYVKDSVIAYVSPSSLKFPNG